MDHLHRRDRGPAGPIVLVGRQRRLLVRGRRQDVAAAADERGAGLKRRGARVDARRDDGEGGAGDDRREVGRGTIQAGHDVGALDGEPNGGLVGRGAAGVGQRAVDVADEADQRRRIGRIDDPEPAPDHVAGGDRRAIAERDAGTEMEDDRRATVAEVPARRERGPGLELGVDRGQALEQLGGDRGTADVALRRRVEVAGRPDQDPDGVVVGGQDGRRAERPGNRPADRRRQCDEECRQRDSMAADEAGRCRLARSSGRARPPRPRGNEAARPGAARPDQTLDRDGLAQPGAACVIDPGEAGKERDDADPAAHGPEYRGGSLGGLRASARPDSRLARPGASADGAGQEVRPRKSHRRGNDALPRGLEPENEETRESLGHRPRNSLPWAGAACIAPAGRQNRPTSGRMAA